MDRAAYLSKNVVRSFASGRTPQTMVDYAGLYPPGSVMNILLVAPRGLFSTLKAVKEMEERIHSISLNDGDAPMNLAILYFRKTACSLPQSLHRSLTLPEMLLYLGFVTSSSSMHSSTLPQSQENDCLAMVRYPTRALDKNLAVKETTAYEGLLVDAFLILSCTV